MEELNIKKGLRITYGCDVPGTQLDYIEASQWTNKDGYSFEVFNHNIIKNVVLEFTYGQIEAFEAIIKQIRKDD